MCREPLCGQGVTADRPHEPSQAVAHARRIVVTSQADLGRPVLLAKIFPFTRRANHLYKLAPSRPTEGRIAIVTDAGRDAVDAAASCAQRDRRAGDEPVSDQQHADERRLQRTAKSCGPDAPTLASSSRMLCRPNRARTERLVR